MRGGETLIIANSSLTSNTLLGRPSLIRAMALFPEPTRSPASAAAVTRVGRRDQGCGGAEGTPQNTSKEMKTNAEQEQ